MCMFSLRFDQKRDLLSSVKHKKIVFEKCLGVHTMRVQCCFALY